MTYSYDKLVDYAMALRNNDKESANIIKDYRASIDGEIDYEGGITPYEAKNARRALDGLRLQMIDYDKDNLVQIAKTDPIMFKLIYDNLVECVDTINEHMPKNWTKNWFFSEIETRSLAYYDAFEMFRSDTHGYNNDQLSIFYNTKSWNCQVVVFSFAIKKKMVQENERQTIVRYLSFVELPFNYDDEHKILSKNKFLYAHREYD